MMNEIGRTLVVIGAAMLLAGVVLLFLGRVGLGKLPGDFVVRRGSFTLLFPLMTSIILSLVLSLLFWLFQKR